MGSSGCGHSTTVNATIHGVVYPLVLSVEGEYDTVSCLSVGGG
jgi:hypothetical protein